VDRHSIKFRLTLWNVAAFAVILLVFGGGVYGFVHTSLLFQTDDWVRRNLVLVTVEVTKAFREPARTGAPGDTSVQVPSPRTGTNTLDPRINLSNLDRLLGVTLFQVVGKDGTSYSTLRWTTLGLPAARWEDADPYDPFWIDVKGHSFRAARVRVHVGPGYQIVVARDAVVLIENLRGLTLVLLIALPLALMLAVLGGWLLAGHALAPVAQMAATARAITAEELDARLPVANPQDELGRLALTFNSTLDRLAGAIGRLKQFTADASHEMRTPLTAMRSVGEVALRDVQDAEDGREAISSMLEETERLAFLVDDLLLLTRGESGQSKGVHEHLDLSALLVACTDDLLVLAEERGQTLTVEVNGPLTVIGDVRMLRRAIINLLDNALKYTPDGGVIQARVFARSRSEVCLEVQDSGPGIAEEYREQVFERFFRVDSARTHEGGGTGLGLAITKMTVELHGGRIELESVLGEGSTFRIVLPMAADSIAG
jgi:heavy metal sensor kinase